MSLENRGVEKGKADPVAALATMGKTAPGHGLYLMISPMLLVLDQVRRGFGNFVVRAKHGAAMTEMQWCEDGLSRFVTDFESGDSSR